MPDITNKLHYRTLNRQAEKGQGSCSQCTHNHKVAGVHKCEVRGKEVMKGKTCDSAIWKKK
jgi:hypothetical protein